MHTASYEFLMKPKESAGCHQTSPRGWGLGTRPVLRWSWDGSVSIYRFSHNNCDILIHYALLPFLSKIVQKVTAFINCYLIEHGCLHDRTWLSTLFLVLVSYPGCVGGEQHFVPSTQPEYKAIPDV